MWSLTADLLLRSQQMDDSQIQKLWNFDSEKVDRLKLKKVMIN